MTILLQMLNQVSRNFLWNCCIFAIFKTWIDVGEAFYGLWDYEVAEVFFLADNKCDGTPDYLELEFGPHGQHLGLYLHGVRKAIKHSFPIEYEAQIDKENGSWTGKAKIPKEYFPPGVNKMNAYAINGPSDGRIYKALYPVPGPQADYHRLEFFVPFDAKFIEGLYSKSWIEAIQNPSDEWNICIFVNIT